jgi:hypothetical protein
MENRIVAVDQVHASALRKIKTASFGRMSRRRSRLQSTGPHPSQIRANDTTPIVTSPKLHPGQNFGSH